MPPQFMDVHKGMEGLTGALPRPGRTLLDDPEQGPPQGPGKVVFQQVRSSLRTGSGSLA